jgi:hypothetical protein
MASPETLCPKCAFSPIPQGAEKCPRCNEVFAFNPLYMRAQKMMVDQRKGLDFEATLRGGLTGAVSAHPAPAATVLALGAALWLIRAAGLFVDLREPSWLFALAAFELCAATVLMANIGPAKLFAQAVAVAHIVAALMLGATLSPHTLASASIGVVVIAMTVGEPSQGRRSGGLIAGFVCSAAAVASLVWVTDPPPAGPVLIDDLRIGYQLMVPAGWKKLTPEELAPHLPLPSEDLDNKYVGFGSRLNRTYGLLTLTNVEDVQLLPACQDQLRRLGAINEPQPLGPAAPEAFGKESMLFELRTASGALGKFGCGKVGKRLVTMGVVVLDPTPGIGASAFERVSAGLTVR